MKLCALTIERTGETGSIRRIESFVSTLVPLLTQGLLSSPTTRKVSMCLCSLLCRANVGLDPRVKRELIERVVSGDDDGPSQLICLECIFGSDGSCSELTDGDYVLFGRIIDLVNQMGNSLKSHDKCFLRKLTKECFRHSKFFAKGIGFLESRTDDDDPKIRSLLIRNSLGLLSRIDPGEVGYRELTLLVRRLSLFSEFDEHASAMSDNGVLMDRLVNDCLVTRHSFVSELGQSLMGLIRSPMPELRREGVARLSSHVQDAEFRFDLIFKIVGDQETDPSVLEACIAAFQNDHERVQSLMECLCFRRDLPMAAIGPALERLEPAQKSLFAFKYAIGRGQHNLLLLLPDNKLATKLIKLVKIDLDEAVQMTNRLQNPIPALVGALAALSNNHTQPGRVLNAVLEAAKFAPPQEDLDQSLNLNDLDQLVSLGVEQTLLSVGIHCAQNARPQSVKTILNDSSHLATLMLASVLQHDLPIEHVLDILDDLDPNALNKLKQHYRPKQQTATLSHILMFAWIDQQQQGFCQCLLHCNTLSDKHQQLLRSLAANREFGVSKVIADWVDATTIDDELLSLVANNTRLLSLLSETRLDQSVVGQLWNAAQNDETALIVLLPHFLRSAPDEQVLELLASHNPKLTSGTADFFRKTQRPITNGRILELLLESPESPGQLNVDSRLVVEMLRDQLTTDQRQLYLLELLDAARDADEGVVSVMEELLNRPPRDDPITYVSHCLRILKRFAKTLDEDLLGVLVDRFVVDWPTQVVEILYESKSSLTQVLERLLSNGEFRAKLFSQLLDAPPRLQHMTRQLMKSAISRSPEPDDVIDRVLLATLGQDPIVCEFVLSALLFACPQNEIRVILRVTETAPALVRHLSTALVVQLAESCLPILAEIAETRALNNALAQLFSVLLTENPEFRAILANDDTAAVTQWISKVLVGFARAKCDRSIVDVLLKLTPTTDFVRMLEQAHQGRRPSPQILLHRSRTDNPLLLARSGFIDYLINNNSEKDANTTFECLSEIVNETFNQSQLVHHSELIEPFKKTVVPECAKHIAHSDQAINCLRLIAEHPGFLLLEQLNQIIQTIIVVVGSSSNHRPALEQLIFVILIKYSGFLSPPQLNQLIRCYLSKLKSLDSLPRLTRVPSRLLVPACVEILDSSDTDDDANNDKIVQYCLAILARAITELTVDQVNSQLVLVRTLLVSLLKSASKNRTPNSRLLIDMAVELVVKMSERVFGGLFPAIIADNDSNYSSSVVFELATALSNHLKNLFTAFASPLVDKFLNEHDHQQPPNEIALRCISSICEHDQTHQLVSSNDRFAQIVDAILEQPSVEQVSECCANVAASANDPALWHTLIEKLVRKSYSKKKKRRLAFVDCVQAIFRKLAASANALIPSVYPRLVELADDPAENVAHAAQSLMAELEPAETQ